MSNLFVARKWKQKSHLSAGALGNTAQRGDKHILPNLLILTVSPDPPKYPSQNLDSISKCQSMFLILLKSSEVPLLIFTYYSPSVGCAAYDDVGPPLIPQGKDGKQRGKLFFFRGLKILWVWVLFQA